MPVGAGGPSFAPVGVGGIPAQGAPSFRVFCERVGSTYLNFSAEGSKVIRPTLAKKARVGHPRVAVNPTTNRIEGVSAATRSELVADAPFYVGYELRLVAFHHLQDSGLERVKDIHASVAADG